MLTRPPEGVPHRGCRAAEGSLAPIACLQSEINQCERCDQCDTLWFWEGMDRAISDYVDQYTLQDFLDRIHA